MTNVADIMFLARRLVRFIITREDTEKALIEIVKRYLPNEINPKANFEELGLDEFQRLEVIAQLELSMEADLHPDIAMMLEDLPSTIDAVVENVNFPEKRKKFNPDNFLG